jgi:hypothetical protein
VRDLKMSQKKFVNEERCRSIFERLLNQKRDGERFKFKKVRPSWLLNHERGFCLELDGYCKQLKLAFEYDGIQHHEYPNPFHRSEREFLQQRKRDEMKNVTLIRIRYDVVDLKGYIRKELRKRKFI